MKSSGKINLVFCEKLFLGEHICKGDLKTAEVDAKSQGSRNFSYKGPVGFVGPTVCVTTLGLSHCSESSHRPYTRE